MEKVKPGDVKGDDLQTLFDTLRHLTEALESGELSLEDSLKTYEESQIVAQRIRDVLNDADRRVVELIKPDGTTEPFELTKR